MEHLCGEKRSQWQLKGKRNELTKAKLDLMGRREKSLNGILKSASEGIGIKMISVAFSE
jgi:hypothetical protein